MSAHSRIGASSMHRWGQCPGSVRLSAGLPNVSSKYAEEGTEAHDLAAKILTTTKIVDLSSYDQEMLDAVVVYVEAFKAALKTGSRFFVEKKFDLSALHPGLFGTSDGVIYHPAHLTLEVWDYKHGAGIPVEVEDNEQLMYYALGALLELKVPCEWVEMVIVQPRCYHPDGPIRSWKISVLDLLDFAADLIDAAKKTEDPNAPLNSGDHCRFCPAAGVCPKLHETALVAAKEEFSATTTYSPEKLAQTLSLLPAIEAWIKSVKEFAYGEANHGRVPPGYKLVPRRPTRKWRDAEEVETKLLMEFGLSFAEVHEPPDLKSPAQIEKLLDKEGKKRLEDLTIKESSGSTLAPDTDKRQALNNAPEAEFTAITEA